MASIDPAAPRASILDLYRAIWTSFRQAIVGHHLAVAVELGMIGAWFVLRTVVDVESAPYLAWALVACTVAVVSPPTGLVILVSTVPFFEPETVARSIGVRHLLVAVLGISVAARLAVGGWRLLPRSPALILAGVLAAVTALGVVHTLADFEQAIGMHAARMWLATIGGALILLIVGAWVARTGVVRPLIAAAIACAVAATLSIAELANPGLISEGSLSWIGFWKDFGPRISGIIPAPNAIAAMLLVPATAALVAVAHFRGLVRLAALAVAVPLIGAAILTWSRTAIVGLFALLVIVAWRRGRALGIVVLAAGLVGGAIAVPLYIQFRVGVVTGLPATQGPIELILGADQARFTAWGAGVQMWLAQPIIGHGFLSYKELAPIFGDARLGSPHNEILRLFAEEGLIGGLAGLAFVVALFRELAKRRGWIGAGLLAGAVAYWLAAMFNNPLLFVQVSAIAFVFAGYGLAAPAHEEPVEMGSASLGDTDTIGVEAKEPPVEIQNDPADGGASLG